MAMFNLMNGNNKIALVEVIGENITVKKMYMEIPSYIINIENLIYNRLNIVGRHNLLTLAKMAGINNVEDMYKISKAISITDTLWMDDINNHITWDKISPYRNRISSIMANIAMNGLIDGNIPRLNSPSPQYRVAGSIDKCVKREGKWVYLYKTDGECWNEAVGKRPYSEYFVAQLEKILGYTDFVNYNVIEDTSGNYIKPYSKCKIFTNERVGLIECEYTIFRDSNMARLYKHLTKDRDKRILRQMILLDSITLNFDRHCGNYGFLINNETLEIIGIAPIYDNDCALGAITSIGKRQFDEAFMEIIYSKQPKGGIGNYDEQALKVIDRQMYNKLKLLGTIKLSKGNLECISDKRVEFINYIINRRIKEIIQLVREKHNLKD